jgi:multidrug efflux pump subunit AcrA (membrane-fusion protein)
MNNTKLFKIMLITLALCVAGFLLPGCTSKSESASVSENQVATVERGDITIDIPAAGNLSYSLEKDLAFDMAGTVEEVLVEVGDQVKEGQVLAKLDASDWEDQQAAKQLDLIQYQINLKNAQTALDKAENPYTDDDIAKAKQAVKDAKDQVDYAKGMLTYISQQHGTELEIQKQEMAVSAAEENLDDAKANLNTMLYERDEDDIAIKQMQLQIAEGRLESAQKAVDEAPTSPEITAPFDGFITQVNVKGGDDVAKGTIAMQIADPTRFEAELLVSEMNIFKVKLGGEAQVQLEVMPALSLPASVTYISPTATIQSGVVNYEVTVEVEPLDTIRQQQQQAMQEQQQGATQQSQITQGQAGGTMRQQQQGGQSELIPTIPEGFQLKEGLTVTVSIIVEQRTGVLLVPNGAITYQGKEAYVQVVSPDGTIEPRSIQTGLSDSQNTEVTSGLSEGEQVVIPQTTTTTTTTSQQGPGGFMFFGEGGPPPGETPR